MNPFPTLPALVARRVRQSLCACALAASLSAAASLSPLQVAGPSRADARQADAGTDSPQSRHRGVPALDLPNLLREGNDPKAPAGDGAETAGSVGIPATALAAYRRAEQTLRGSQPLCHLPWQLVAGIGRVESVHASGYGLHTDGTTARPIRGPRLDGVQFALIRDTDGGRWDGDAAFDRAVGPMQFIPSTWGSWGADGNGDGVKDPNNIFDAALGTARYLCAGERDLSRSADLDKAILSYNNSRAYVNAVRKWMDTYRGTRITEVPDDAPATPHHPDPAAGPTPRPPAHRPARPGQLARPDRDRTTPSRMADVSDTSGGATGGTTPSRPSNKPAPGPGPGPGPAPDPVPVADHHTVVRLERLGDPRLEAEAGAAVGRQPQVRAVDAHGHPVPGAEVTFRGAEVRFPEGATTATVTADRDGIATAPALRAGDRPGRFTLTATASGTTVSGDRSPAADFTVTVRPASYLLELWDQDRKHPPVPLRADPDSLLSELPFLRITRHGHAAAGLRIAASVLTAGEDGKPVPGEVPGEVSGGVSGEDGKPESDLDGKPEPGPDGPSFQDGHGRPVRSLLLAPADAEGRLTLPPLRTGPHPGSYILRLTTPSGDVLDVPLTVTGPVTRPVTGPRVS
ncbi:hypothetical protein A6A06_24835 [Streptomyces sp. CB02923]|uniref:lytic transglycosylase domain-containing protein n=1 Tax=Streptomyces sp. CB02923 TaxID=1718985 RepID=UPI00095F8C12|nr:lytic murein transglycosylase [Streptomyces sp. CB02923]OKH98851.1 hypothetical protein A6A06_24835 [Streptomyces sp. CB02923]